MSSNEDYEKTALEAASRTFVNPAAKIEADQMVEYYSSPFLAWQTYEYKLGVFKEGGTNGPWTQRAGVEFSSSSANQDRLACSTDRVFGDRCILLARYGRYVVFFRANLSDEFTVQDVQPLLREIDERMSYCADK